MERRRSMTSWSPLRHLPRTLRHIWLDAADARRLLPADALGRLEAVVHASEARHLGELRLCVEAGLPWHALRGSMNARQRAIELFSTLRVWDTAHNNGVLIYLLLADQRIEVVADRGVSSMVTPETWQALADRLRTAMQQGKPEQGLNETIGQVSALLHEHYPALKGVPRINELPDAVVLL
jgi:uncharacterized membrane protein